MQLLVPFIIHLHHSDFIHSCTPEAWWLTTEKTGADLGTLVNAINIGVLVSALISSQLCEILGRKKPITIGTALITIGSALQGGAQTLGMFIAGRVIIGLGTGIVAVAAPQLMMEAAYPTHRGKMVSLYMTQWVVVGHLIFYIDAVWREEF